MRSTHTRTAAVTLGLALTVPALAGSASATVGQAPQGKAIASTSGAVVQVPAPADARANAYESDTEIRAWNERKFQLTEPLAVDIREPGTYGQTGDLSIEAGSCVFSQFMHFDLVGTEGGGALQGSLTTTSNIRGIIVKGSKLNDSDFLGAAGTQYGKEPNRATETSSTTVRDGVTLSQDRRTVTVDLGTAAAARDELRIITAASNCESDPEPVVPESPLAVALPLVALAGGGALVLARRRRTA